MMLSNLSLKLSGWQFEGEKPSVKKYVCLAVPHTSNWDGVLLVMVTRSIGMSMSFMIKGSWVKGPFAPLLKGLGAIPIDRSRSHNVVSQMIDEMKSRDELALVIPPEGTRRRADYWKSGFYHIARGANVPVVPGYLDYGRKRAGLGPPIEMTGDVRADMDKIRDFYTKLGPAPHRPECFGPMRLREEEQEP
jgi:1-acyl-sn-glycerol-3-phosphate acyltransferase